MTIVNRSYAKGYRFERNVKKRLEDAGYKVIRQGKSAFPDLIALPNLALMDHRPLIIECKVNKYISRDEREKFREYDGRGLQLVAYPETNAANKTRKDVVLTDLHYNEVRRL